jgi:Eco29kI restriction endonuclease
MINAYNPLDKVNLAKSIETELLTSTPSLLSDVGSLKGAGVYAIYYIGDFKPYVPIKLKNLNGLFSQPIYVGKAIPKGGRKGGLSIDLATSIMGRSLADRLGQHAQSIVETQNLKIEDFFVRYLVVDDIWIPLGENMLIETFKPIWNRALDGFGNKDPGRRRATQYRSPWDVVHPGRRFTEKLAESPLSLDFLTVRISDYLSGRPLAKLPKAVIDQLMEDEE